MAWTKRSAPLTTMLVNVFYNYLPKYFQNRVFFFLKYTQIGSLKVVIQEPLAGEKFKTQFVWIFLFLLLFFTNRLSLLKKYAEFV